MIARISPNDFSNEAFPFGTAQEIEIGMGLARAHRVTYVGELGWELYVSSDQAAHVFEAIEEAGTASGLKLCGLHALDSCRIEKAYRHFGHDLTDEDHVLEAGLGFAVKTGKGNFIGRDAVLRKREEGLKRRLLQFRLRDPGPLLFHNEAIVRDGKIVSIITSGNYGHHLGGAIGLGYVPCAEETEEEVLASNYEIEVAGERFARKRRSGRCMTRTRSARSSSTQIQGIWKSVSPIPSTSKTIGCHSRRTGSLRIKKAPRLLASAEGMHYRDIDGNRVLDGTAGLWCVNAGHGSKSIAQAVERQLSTLDYAPSFQMGHPVAFQFAERLANVAPGKGDGKLKRIFYTGSGSESVDTAICPQLFKSGQKRRR